MMITSPGIGRLHRRRASAPDRRDLSPLKALTASTNPDVSVLQEEFPDVEHHSIVLALRTTEHNAEEAHECFQSTIIVSALRADLSQVHNRAFPIDRFRDLFSHSPSPIASAEDRAAFSRCPRRRSLRHGMAVTLDSHETLPIDFIRRFPSS
jgi:hypothetical protein